MQLTKEMVEKRIEELMIAVEKRKVALDNAVGALAEMQLLQKFLNKPDEAKSVESTPDEAKPE